MQRHKKLWMTPMVFILAVLIASVFLWPTFKIYLAPKTVLTAALTDTCTALEERAKNSPVLLLANTLDFENGNTLALNLTTESKLLGTLQYDMDIQAKWFPRQFSGQGQLISRGKVMDLSVYLDSDFASLSSAGLLQGKHYGITYHTFSRDIRDKQLLAVLIGESKLRDLEEKVNALQTFMTNSQPLPELSREDFKQILMGILALRAEVDREQIHVNGVQEDFYVISFETSGKTIRTGLRYLNAELPFSIHPDEKVNIAFWLQEDSITKIRLEAGEREVVLQFGPDAASDDLRLSYRENGNIQSIQIHTQQDASCFRETITVNDTVFSYQWSLDSGDLELKRIQEGEEVTLSANLTGTEEGFRFETGDFEGWMHLLLGTKDSANSPCTLSITKGSSIITPEYKNFSSWTLEDLVTFLGGFGNLLGLNTL